MGGLSIWKVLLILAVILFVFGGRRLPELGKSLGLGLANFRKSLNEAEDKPADPEKGDPKA
jgi:sec-independent protein translocase protein TatA